MSVNYIVTVFTNSTKIVILVKDYIIDLSALRVSAKACFVFVL